VQCARGEAKFWLEPSVTLARSIGLSAGELKAIEDIVKEHEDEIKSAWRKHFDR
jgi:hypothetical protein